MTGTLVNVAAIVAGTVVGQLVGGRLTAGLQARMIHGVGLVVLVIGIDNALAWRGTNVLFVLGGVLLGGLVGEALGIERRLEARGDLAQARISRSGGREGAHAGVSEAFVTSRTSRWGTSCRRWSSPRRWRGSPRSSRRRRARRR